MKLITKDIDYAVRALVYLAKNGNHIVSVGGLVKELKIPKPFLRKILQILHKKGILNAFKGKNGGFILARSSDRIFLVELIEIFQGQLQLNECVLRKNLCSDINTCVLRSKINDIEQDVINKLKSITITSLLQGR